MEDDAPVEHAIPRVLDMVLASRARTYDMFQPTTDIAGYPPLYPEAAKQRALAKAVHEYPSQTVPERVMVPLAARPAAAAVPGAAPLMLTGPTTAPLLLTDASAPRVSAASTGVAAAPLLPQAAASGGGAALPPPLPGAAPATGLAAIVSDVSSSLAARQAPVGVAADSVEELRRAEELAAVAAATSRAMVARRAPAAVPTPKWHAPWKLARVISGHMGWVRAVAVDPSNAWFVTGSADRTLKIWDLATGGLKLTLTGHINAIRAVEVSARHPYLFSAAEDKNVKCWDLETNKCVREYHGHLSGVYSLALHPTVDILATGGRDAVVRVWDMRTRAAIHVLGGHDNTVSSILASGSEPQLISGGMDNTIRTWDLVAGKVRTVLTHHKKSVRALVGHPREYAFVSGAADALKKWALPDATLVKNYHGHNAIVNAMALNADDVLVSAGDDGSLKFWDYSTGYSFQEAQTRVQPGSLDSEAGIYGVTFDRTGTRLITVEADKTIKVYKEDPDATPDTHPLDMEGWGAYCRAHKEY